MDELTRRRLEHNEQLFRDVNDARERAQGVGGEPVAFVCECADRSCAARIELTLEEYQAIRSDPKQFVLLPGHAIAGLEHVVEQGDGFEVVEKR